MWELILFLVLGYLLGSVLPAYWLTRWLRGKDIRTLGDLNPGVANAFRSVGLVVGIVAGVFDLAKGAVAVALAQAAGISGVGLVAVGAAAVAGHVWPIFMGFDGGAGGATALGVTLAIFPVETAVATATAAPAFFLGHRLLPQRREVPAALVLVATCLIAVLVAGRPLEMILSLAGIAVFVALRVLVWRHRRYWG